LTPWTRDDAFPTKFAIRNDIREPETLNQRCDVADRLIRDKKLTMPVLVDEMGDRVARSYRAWPDRIFVIDENAKIGVAGGRGPMGFGPGLKRARKWLAGYRESHGGPAGSLEPSSVRSTDDGP